MEARVSAGQIGHGFRHGRHRLVVQLEGQAWIRIRADADGLEDPGAPVISWPATRCRSWRGSCASRLQGLARTFGLGRRRHPQAWQLAALQSATGFLGMVRASGRLVFPVSQGQTRWRRKPESGQGHGGGCSSMAVSGHQGEPCKTQPKARRRCWWKAAPTASNAECGGGGLSRPGSGTALGNSGRVGAGPRGAPRIWHPSLTALPSRRRAVAPPFVLLSLLYFSPVPLARCRRKKRVDKAERLERP